MGSLGYCYENGEGVEQDYEQALLWYQRKVDVGYKAAEQDVARVEELLAAQDGAAPDEGDSTSEDAGESMVRVLKKGMEGDDVKVMQGAAHATGAMHCRSTARMAILTRKRVKRCKNSKRMRDWKWMACMAKNRTPHCWMPFPPAKRPRTKAFRPSRHGRRFFTMRGKHSAIKAWVCPEFCGKRQTASRTKRKNG